MKKLIAVLVIVWGLIEPVLGQKHVLENALSQAEEKGFSGVILVAENGEILFEKAIGMRSYENKIPLQSTDVFELASVSKQFTAMMVMRSAEKGLLDYDDLVSKYLEIPYSGITIRQLLTHTSGLPDYQAIMDQHWDKTKVAGNPEILKYLNRYHPPAVFAPGEKYEYSNTGYVLLGSIVEKASGRDFIELTKEWIFEPLEMENTGIRTLEEKALVPNFAAGHLPDSTGSYVNANQFHESDYTVWLGNRKGPGRVSSTAQDLLKWDQALYKNQLVSQASLKEAFKPQQLNDATLSYYGFGWEIEPRSPLGFMVSHTGDNPGYKTIIVRYLEKNQTIILLNNNAHGDWMKLVEAATLSFEK
jgi:CubicO group peptidase (beta-lactamase class C family)